MSQLKIRAANEGDIPFILACEASPAGKFVQADNEATHRANCTNPNFTYLIAEDSQDQPLGYAMLVTSADGRKEWRRIIIGNPGNGIGTTFMHAVIKEIFTTGAPAIWLDVYEDNERARHVYKKLGFVETNIAPAPHSPDRNLVIMELTRPE